MSNKTIRGPAIVMPRAARAALAGDGRLPEEAFRARARELGIVSELERLGLWAEDESAEIPGKLTWRDLERIQDFSPVRMDAENEIGRSATKLEKAVRQIHEALKAYRWARSLSAIGGFGYEDRFIILRSQSGDETGDIIDLDCSMVEEDFLEHLENCASNLARLAERARARGNRSQALRGVFARKWFEFADSKCGKPLDEVGALLSQIIFGRPIDVDSYAESRKRNTRRQRQTKSCRGEPK
ncbi:MAG TPA: hypothetical protein VF701_08635 [Thermoanaerobaculia bacterium]